MDKVLVIENVSYDNVTKRFSGYDEALLERIRIAITEKKAVLLKNVFEKGGVTNLKEHFFDLMQKMEESNPTVNGSCPNFFRKDVNPEKSAVKRIKQFVTSYYWNPPFFNEQDYMSSMSRFRNEIAGLPSDYATEKIEEDGYFTSGNVSQYPLGGGHLNKHQDPPNKQFCVIIASLSTKGEDFNSGGLYFYYDNEKIMLDDYIESGDVYLMNPQSIHGIDEISDGYETPLFDSIKGRWILFPTLIELKTTQGIKVEGLKDLGQG